ncbi:MAG: type II toxin-antitoxin system VapC family toxin, partial [Acidimicrobiia bacterium]
MSRTPLLVDTSVAVALVVAGHEAHDHVLEFLDRKLLGLAGHAWFETYSVLTRLPAPARRRPAEVAEILGTNFPESRFLPEAAARRLVDRLAALEISGGAVYDGLVGATAAHHHLTLVSRDRRAIET